MPLEAIIWAIIIAASALLFWGIVSGRLKSRGNGFAALTAFHDWQPEDKQKAIEIVIQRTAGFEQKRREDNAESK